MVSNRFTNSSNPQHVNSRIFIGNVDCDKTSREDLEKIFSKYGEILGVSLHKTFAFVQFNNEDSAKSAASETNQTLINNKKIDVNIASERRKQQHPSRDREGMSSHSSSRSSEPHSSQPRMRGPSRFSDEYSYNSPYGYERSSGSNMGRAAPYYQQSAGGYSSSQSQYVGYPPVVPQPPQSGSNQSSSGGQSEHWAGYQPHHVSAPTGTSIQDLTNLSSMYLQSSMVSTERDYLQPAVVATPAVRSPVECEVIAANPKFNNYAEYLSGQIVARGLKCNVNIPSHETLVQALKNRAMSTGVPFCVLIENGNEIHPSITLCLYFSSPEEHRNMTVDSALELLQAYIVRLGYGTSANIPNGGSVVVSSSSAPLTGSVPLHKPSGQMTFPAAAVKYSTYGVESRELYPQTNYSGSSMLPR